jgi:hypothetical protein
LSQIQLLVDEVPSAVVGLLPSIHPYQSAFTLHIVVRMTRTISLAPNPIFGGGSCLPGTEIGLDDTCIPALSMASDWPYSMTYQAKTR